MNRTPKLKLYAIPPINGSHGFVEENIGKLLEYFMKHESTHTSEGGL